MSTRGAINPFFKKLFHPIEEDTFLPEKEWEEKTEQKPQEGLNIVMSRTDDPKGLRSPGNRSG